MAAGALWGTNYSAPGVAGTGAPHSFTVLTSWFIGSGFFGGGARTLASSILGNHYAYSPHRN